MAQKAAYAVSGRMIKKVGYNGGYLPRDTESVLFRFKVEEISVKTLNGDVHGNALSDRETQIAQKNRSLRVMSVMATRTQFESNLKN